MNFLYVKDHPDENETTSGKRPQKLFSASQQTPNRA